MGVRQSAGMPSPSLLPTPPLPAYHARLLLLDFDGVLHPVSALRAFERGLTRDQVIRTERLFRWTYVLAELLKDHEDVRVAVHSSWRRLVPDEQLRAYLGLLSERFVGATPRELTRWPSIRRMLALAQPSAWLVLDDHASEFPTPLPAGVVICDSETGAWHSRTRETVASWLRLTRNPKSLSCLRHARLPAPIRY